VLGDAALAGDPRFCSNVQRVANRPALDGIIADRFGRRTREEVAALLDDADIAFGRLNSVADLAVHPQLRRITAAMGGTAISLPAPAGGGDPALRVPELNEHGLTIRREFAR
jgi:crotonobetainyl-CoA:carnitine CoA-transferase CaiB-like acyl-CoA transferase